MEMRFNFHINGNYLQGIVILYNLSSWYNAIHPECIKAYCIEIPSQYTAYEILCWGFDFGT